MNQQRQQFKFRKHSEIGTLDAESDDLLMQGFVSKEELTLVRDTSSHKCILLGRTGSGKSALIRYLESNSHSVVRIAPESISLRHLSNSNIIQYFNTLGVKLDLFYKMLWKHVLLVEILKIFINQKQKRSGFMNWLRQSFPDKKYQRALNYLEKWENHFWEDTEYQVRELEASLEKRFSDSLEIKIPLMDLISSKYLEEHEVKTIERIKVEVENKAKKVVNESQMEEIDILFRILKDELMGSLHRDVYIVIDDLDKEWVSTDIVYDLVKALLDTIREFRQIPRLKVIVALRSNIHEIVFSENRSRGLQREKFTHLYLRLHWTEAELAQLLDNRLAILMKGTYTNEVPTHVDVLPAANGRKESGLRYMLDRSFMRPRDVIDYFNKCIQRADGKTKITREVIRSAEYEYSRARLQAVHDEWLENYGNVDCLFELVTEIDHRFLYTEIKARAQSVFVEILAGGRHNELSAELRERFKIYGDNFDLDRILPWCLVVLYEIGVLGIKATPDSTVTYSYRDEARFGIDSINDKVNFYVHPMFHRALRIKELAQGWIRG